MFSNHYEFCALTNTGNVRATNQDALHVDMERKLVIVADGMGDHKGGDIASKLAIGAIKSNYKTLTTDTSKEILADCITIATETIAVQSTACSRLHGMGTTIVIGAIYNSVAEGKEAEDILAISWMGDSRAYMFRAGNLEQLTKDHTAPNGHLTQAVGYNDGTFSDYTDITVKPGDIYVFMTDGLYKDAPVSVMENILSSRKPVGIKASMLVDAALHGGGNDNITVVLVEVKPAKVKKYF